ncbi:hypothetical protein ABPG74_014473 [Tetrahymena malaccensis]
MNNLNIQRLAKNVQQLALNSKYTVLVTGANGFLSSHIIQQLLHLNYKVRGTVRNLADKKKYSHFYEIIPQQFHNNLSFAQADLSSEEGWDEAVKDCRYVLHVASPFNYEAKTPEEIINPAVLGTRYVLNACVKHSQTIKKVVLTSSGKAIFEGNTQRVHFDESIWQNYENSGYYGQSKYFAEKEAWKIYEENKDKLNLSTINPTLILGPSLSKYLSASQGVITNLLNGKLIPQPITFGIVDVRDVAAAHILAMQDDLFEVTRGKRYITCSQSMWVKDIAAVLKEYYQDKQPQLQINTKELTHEEFVAKAQSLPIYKETLRMSGQYFIMDNTQSLKDLGMQYIQAYHTLIETSDEIIKYGL